MVTTRVDLTSKKYNGRVNPISFIVIHTMEAPEGSQTAENVAAYFGRVNASAHWCVDNNSRVRVVQDNDTAWTTPGCNSRSLNIELAGYARQDNDDWKDAYSIAELEIAAICAAEWVKKYDIPIRHLSDSQIARYEKGFIGHVDANRVFKKSTHWDPGPNFPWNYFLERVAQHAKGKVTPTPSSNWDNRGYSMSWIKKQQRKLNELGYKLDVDGKLGPKTRSAVKEIQKKHDLEVDGIPGPKTSKVLDRLTKKDDDKKPDASKKDDQPKKKPNVTELQRALRTKVDNKWGPNTDKSANALREASRWGGVDFPYGKAFAQKVVGTKVDNSWGAKSRAAHDRTTREVQKALKRMGFDPGKIDGIWGEATEKAYQAARKAAHI